MISDIASKMTSCLSCKFSKKSSAMTATEAKNIICFKWLKINRVCLEIDQNASAHSVKVVLSVSSST